MRAAPLNPGQALAVRAEGRGGVKVGAFGQHLALAGAQVDADQPVLLGVFFHGQYLAVGKLHVAVAAGAVGQRVRCAAVQEPL